MEHSLHILCWRGGAAHPNWPVSTSKDRQPILRAAITLLQFAGIGPVTNASAMGRGLIEPESACCLRASGKVHRDLFHSCNSLSVKVSHAEFRKSFRLNKIRSGLNCVSLSRSLTSAAQLCSPLSAKLQLHLNISPVSLPSGRVQTLCQSPKSGMYSHWDPAHFTF